MLLPTFESRIFLKEKYFHFLMFDLDTEVILFAKVEDKSYKPYCSSKLQRLLPFQTVSMKSVGNPLINIFV